MNYQSDRWAEATVAQYCFLHPEALSDVGKQLSDECWKTHVGLVFRAMKRAAEKGLTLNQRTLLKQVVSNGGFMDSFKTGWRLMLSEGTPEMPDVLDRAIQSMNAAHAESERERRLEKLRLLNEAGDHSGYLTELTNLVELEKRGARSLQTPDVESLSELNVAELSAAESVLGYGLLNEGGLMWLHAPDGAGKTLLALQMASSIALGRPWLDEYDCRPKRVLYLQGELGRPWWQKRTRQLMEYEEGRSHSTEMVIDLSDLLFCHTHFPLARVRKQGRQWYTDMSGIGTLEAMIREHRAEVVFIDPLSKFYGLEENSTDQNREFVNRLLDLRLATGATLVILHHDRKSKDGESEMRGSSALSADADSKARLQHVAQKTSSRGFKAAETYLVWEKVRHAAKPARLRLTRGEGTAFFEKFSTFGRV